MPVMDMAPPHRHERPVSYAKALAERPVADIDLVVIHCTELPDLATAREYAERIHYSESRTGNCGHYTIDRDGRVERWVPLNRVAHHVRGYNARSVGVELVNLGRYPDWFASTSAMTQPYTAEQMHALSGLLAELVTACPSLRWIAGHEDLDRDWVAASDDPAGRVRRKLDPGPLFPWPQVLAGTPLEKLEPEGK